MVFLGLKHTILLNILLINHMVCRTINYVLVFVNTRDTVWSCSWWFIPTRKTETREKHINDCERAERASRNFGTFASETLNSSQSVNNILLVKNSVQYVLVLVDLFRNTYNDDTDKKQLRNECEWPNELKVSYILHRKHTIFSIFWYNDVLVLFNLYGRNYKMYLQNSKN